MCVDKCVCVCLCACAAASRGLACLWTQMQTLRKHVHSCLLMHAHQLLSSAIKSLSIDIQVDFSSLAMHTRAHPHAHTHTRAHTHTASKLPTAWNKTEIWPRLLSHVFELPLHLRLKHWWKRKTLQRPHLLFKADSGLPQQSLQRRNSKHQLDFFFLSLRGELSQNEKWIPFASTFSVLMLLRSIIFFIYYR